MRAAALPKIAAVVLSSSLVVASCLSVLGATSAGAASGIGTTSSWCAQYGASVVGWTGSTPNLPICGPGPGNGGSWADVMIPGPYGSAGHYFNATPGFQCVELAERYLAVVDGLGPVLANGQQVAANYHAAYANTHLYANGSRQAVGHAPGKGDVVSFSNAPGFDAYSDGHVAVVIGSSVDHSTGDGTITLAQENVGAGYWIDHIDVVHWRLVDPTSPGDALFGFAYAEWLHVTPYRSAEASSSVGLLTVNSSSGAIAPVAGIVADLDTTHVASHVRHRFVGAHRQTSK